MAMSREKFIEIMERLHDLDTNAKEVNDIGAKHGFFIENSFFDESVELLISALSTVMNDQTDAIDYFIFGLEFGKKDLATNCILHTDGSCYSLRTAGDLYDYLLIKATPDQVEARGWHAQRQIQQIQ